MQVEEELDFWECAWSVICIWFVQRICTPTRCCAGNNLDRASQSQAAHSAHVPIQTCKAVQHLMIML
jgi:hypothetical protein